MKFIIVSFIFTWTFGYAQSIKVKLDLYGDSKGGELFKVLPALPLYKVKENYYFTEIPNKRFRNNKLNTIQLLVKKKSNKKSFFPSKIICLNAKENNLKFNYNNKNRLITIKKKGKVQAVYHIFDLTSRNGNIRAKKLVSDGVLSDTSEWLGIDSFYVKYGELNIGQKKYSIAIADKNSDSFFGTEFDLISIDTSLSRYQHAAINSRCEKIDKTKYLDFEGEYYEIKKIDKNGKFVRIEKCSKIIEDSCIYIDNNIRNYNFTYQDSIYSIHDFLNQNKYIVLDIWTEYCPPCIRDIPKLNELEGKYSDKVIFLGLFDGELKDLIRMENNYDIHYQVGVLSDKIKKDVLQSGYPYKLIISPSGKIIKTGISKTSEIEEFIKKIL